MTPLEKLFEFLRIPSISADPAHAADVRRAAEWVAGELSGSLERVEIIDAPGRHPLVYGEWLGAPGKPTLLLYGHYDVQPPDPLEQWISPPFEPAVRNGNVYARGACDDKGQVMIQLAALERLRGQLPVNIKVLIEGEEESGGEHLEAFVPANRERLRADAALVCDTEMFAPGLPTLCTGLRGIIYGELHATGPRVDLHSGVYGGAAPNPFMTMARVLTAIKGDDEHVRIPGFYDAVRTPAPEELAAWASLPFDEAAYAEHEVGAPLVGEAGFDLFRRTWARPTFEVHGIRGGFTGEGSKTVIPATAVAKVSMRLVPDQDPESIIEHLRAMLPPQVRFELLHTAPACLVDPTDPFIAKAAEALTETFGAPTVYMRSGGSIPVVGLFTRELGIPSVLMGFGLPDDNLHSPNEKFNLENFAKGIDAVECYLRRLGA